MAAKGTEAVPLVRVPANDDVFIKCVLDAGAGGVLVPQVRSPQDVQRAVAACLYPPDGIRGFGPRRPANYERNYPEVVKSANDHIVVWVQIEHLEAIEQIEKIVKTPRLDGVIIGPGDLSASLGVIFQKRHPKVLEAIERVKTAAQRAGVPAGMAGLTDAQEAIEWIRKGFQFATLGTSDDLLMRASRDFIASVRQGIEERL